ncbi:MAG: NAD-dependent epimerase/dehydratase family protein [Bacteroidetes bacterium]|nr:NAD-dependent epimerase/dehydratase family protein [Bacteroidota bacterium]
MEIAKDNKTALVLGASGLIGGYLTQFLLLHPAYENVVIFVRKPLNLKHPKLVQHIVDFDDPASFKHLVKGDDLFCCLGTTMAIAGSKAAFYKVDFTYPFEVAKIALDNRVGQYLLVSSVGADPNSRFFYSRVKGELELALRKLDFWSLHIFQPSVLLGERNENCFGEQLAGRIGKVFDRLTGGLLTKYRPIEADVVAKAMVSAAQGLKAGVHVYPSHFLQALAAEIDQALIAKNLR